MEKYYLFVNLLLLVAQKLKFKRMFNWNCSFAKVSLYVQVLKLLIIIIIIIIIRVEDITSNKKHK